MTEQERLDMLSAMKQDKEGGKAKFWSPGGNFEGTKVIRILPPLKKLNERVFYFSHKVHFIGGMPFEDLEQTIYDENGKLIHEPEPDPVNAFVKNLYRGAEKGSDEWKLASTLKFRQRYISRIIVRDRENPNSEIQPVFYEYGPTIYNILYHIMTETDFGNIVDPKNGRDFSLTKTGIGRQSKYETSTPSANQTSIFNDATKLKEMFDNAMLMTYSSLIEFHSREEKERALREFLGEDVTSTKTYSTPSVHRDPPVVQPDLTEDETFSADEIKEDTEEDDIDAILSEMV
jgi:hypothetical protein